ncbi:hypothetical protein ADL22_32535 [Streptomyces sp. NRRL F-4489]|uniref:hypothetical protein n=1 Tax=Streptomyces sp. NRRL F-4489 TaxID=1609095 RepID=UPI000749DCDA|nr:hypothetical protein [Streptomyces sp. NRRL F-4489]KUL33635.1 hypothetical protein ADL22_32535 [Streptomyces sp. NRRL F-4489]
MPRRSFVPGAALLVTAALAAGLSGCGGGSATGTGGGDGKTGDATAATQAAEPGRYQYLPEPCGLPARSSLRAMLPGDGQPLAPADAEKIYAGRSDITYDTDRRVGCQWTRETAEGTRHLTLDIQRVVSYSPAVSDDDRAAELYRGKEQAAGIPSGGGPTATPKDKPGDKPSGGPSSPSATPGGTDPGGKKADGAAQATPTPTPTPSDPSVGPGGPLAPRELDGLGDAAFLNDRLSTTDSGVHRDVTVVFRTSNVIVTITYDQWSADKTKLPESQELQDKARSLAGELVDSLSE